MTLEEFFIALDAHGVKFVRRGNQIRTKDGECPLCALANRISGRNELTLEYFMANKILDLPKNDISNIVHAADCVPWWWEASEIRDKLFGYLEGVNK